LNWIGYAVVAYGLATWLLPTPLTLLHELGHALPALRFVRGSVVVIVGRQPARPVRLGRLELRVRPLNSPRWGWFGHVEADEETSSRAQAAVVVLGGPVVTALVLAVLLVAATIVPWPPSLLLWGAALTVAWQLLVTAVPMRYPRWFGPYAGRVSDGYRIVRLLRPS
jgi:hypothetical protein